MLLICFFSNKCWSSSAPRSLTTGIAEMAALPIVIALMGSQVLAWHDLKWTTSVFPGLHARPLLVKQVKTSLTHSSILDRKAERSLLGLMTMYSCESSAYIIQSKPWAFITSSTGAKNKENRRGPSTEPCGTPYRTSLSADKSFPIFTDWVRFDRYDLNQSRTVPLKPYRMRSLSSSTLWSIVYRKRRISPEALGLLLDPRQWPLECRYRHATEQSPCCEIACKLIGI